jgi:putative transposase
MLLGCGTEFSIKYASRGGRTRWATLERIRILRIAVPSINSVRLGSPGFFRVARGSVGGTRTILHYLLHGVLSGFHSRANLQLEVIALRHQLDVLRRYQRTRVRLTRLDRSFWILLYRLWPCCLDALVIVEPPTVIRWHRKGFRTFWSWKSCRRRWGRPPITAVIRNLIRRMSRENPLWGAPRIHSELLKLRIAISQATASKYMARHPRPPSQTWRTFLKNHIDGLASTDLFVVPTATFSLLYALIVVHHERRRIVHFGVTPNPTATWVAQQITEAFPWGTAPRYLIHDRDAVYGSVVRGRLRTIGIEEVVTAPRSPWQNPFAERVIGSIRRDCLDHVIVLDERHLRRLLSSYVDYYHRSRTHLALDKDAPDGRPVQRLGDGKVVSFPQVGGLHHRYERLAA